MGLDTTHGAWHGSYSYFNRWREAIAKAAGYELAVITSGKFERRIILLDWGHITENNLLGEWDQTPQDPLLVLFAHSDCEGSIFPEQAIPLADALESLLPELEDDPFDYIVRATKNFIYGLRTAATANEPLEFH